DMFIEDLIQTKNGDYVLSGTAFSAVGSDNIVIRIDSMGNILWKTKIDLSTNDGIYHSYETNDFDLIVAGDTSFFGNSGNSNRAMVARLDSSGNLKWAEILSDS